jgi:hypothetical protein
MQTAPACTLPTIDGRLGPTAEDIEAFHNLGALRLTNVISAAEVAALRDETQPYLERALAITPSQRPGEDDDAYRKRVSTHANAWGSDPPGAPDTFYNFDRATGNPRPWGLDFISEKLPTLRVAIANPRILMVLEALMGQHFIYGYDHMVMKVTGEAPSLGYHTDVWVDLARERKPVCVVGIYLDDADEHSGLWAVPGSHLLSQEQSQALRKHMNTGPDGPRTEGAVPIPARAGDIVIHNAMTAHGSMAGRRSLRRTAYAWFFERDVARIWYQDTFLRLGHRKLFTCMSDRMASPLSVGEEPYHYRCRLDGLTEVEPDWWRRPLYRNPAMARTQGVYG